MAPAGRPWVRQALPWVGVAMMVFPPFLACATGDSGEVPDGGSTLPDGAKRDGNHEGDSGSGEEGSADSAGPCTEASQCCTSAECPPTAHVATTSCNNGSCGISTCSPGWYEFDASYSGGCNCEASTNGSSCATATVVPSLTLGAKTTVTGNLPTASSEAWYQITFSGDAQDKTYHPEINVTTNPSNEFVFDISSACSGPPLSCADLDAGDSVTTWEEFYDSKDAGTGPDTGKFVPIKPVGAAGEVLIRVHRANPGASCDAYVITISD
jgi:hypothetical protein